MVEINHTKNSLKFKDKFISKKDQLIKIMKYKPTEILEFSNSREIIYTHLFFFILFNIFTTTFTKSKRIQQNK